MPDLTVDTLISVCTKKKPELILAYIL